MRFPAMCRWQSSCLWYQAECTCLVKRCSCLCCSNCRRFECLHILRNWSDSVKPWRDGCGNQCTSNTCKYFAFWPILAFCCLQSCVRHVSVATSNSRRLGLMQPWWACIGVPGQIPLPGICLCSFEIEIHPVSTWLPSVLLATYPDVTENCLKNHTLSLAGQRLLKDLWHGCSMCRIKTKRGWVSQKKLILVPGCLLIKIIQVHHVRVQSRV